ncbi:MAG TPA: pyrroloquinoline quinone biosynthesis protein PqqB [Flavobacteriales bacterium]|nr:pyrroloquinoline quinone biosynthesis protein PqqB [Flavobacteriales bacterium]HIO68771.1 pyrroloquinoline quinone biosynthesis protein PqqB [Flavobacteriales bacterium]
MQKIIFYASLSVGSILLVLPSCNETKSVDSTYADQEGTALVVLGTIQDAGSPQAGCNRKCCAGLYRSPDVNRKVVSIGVIDYAAGKKWMFEATPDFTSQVNMLNDHLGVEDGATPDGIFLTHAHIGHYTGLMYLGKEAMGASSVPVYAMPRMRKFLTENGPWSQLVSNNNITLQPMEDKVTIQLTPGLKVTPFLVPHRDEFSETVGYRIEGPTKKVLFIPDIDKWAKWETSIMEEIQKVDLVYLDATFYDGEELNYRAMSEVPHPFIVESMELFKDLPASEKSKIHFIHFNHTNPALDKSSMKYAEVINNGFKIAETGEMVKL